MLPTDASELGFGKTNSAHMLLADFGSGKWHNHRIVPFSAIDLHPFSTILHYGAQVFEGLKVYRAKNSGLRLFRPKENLKRLNNSAARLCLPQIELADFMQMLEEFITLEKDYVPTAKCTSLYLRPCIFGSDDTLGVYPPKTAKFMLVASSVGNYYKGGLKPVKILVETEDIRAAIGGTGHTKAGGNYAASLRATQKAITAGYDQVLWLDAINRRFIEEVGAMNVFFIIDGVAVTPALTGSILPGITRMSCIELLKSKGIKVDERQITINEVVLANKSGRLTEMFGTGTAAVVSPVGTLGYNNKQHVIGNNQIGEITSYLYDTLTGIQFGDSKLGDPFNWIYKVL